MIPLLLALACSVLACSVLACSEAEPPQPATTVTPAEPAEDWTGVPLKRGEWPDWVPQDHTKWESVAIGSDGRRAAHRIAAPRPTAVDGDESTSVSGAMWKAKVVPAEEPVQAWEIDLFAEPERVAGTPLRLLPSGGEVVAVADEVEVRGVLDLGHQAYGFRCLGVGADMTPEGWCLGLISQVWLETWEEGAAP